MKIKNNIKNEPLDKLRNKMEEQSIDACIIPMNDYHLSEYVGEYFKVVRYISGFTGSAGTVVVTKDEAGLWTDGRYFIQAEKELKDKGVKLFKQGVKGVPNIKEFLKEKLKNGGTVGLDGKVISAEDYMDITYDVQREEERDLNAEKDENFIEFRADFDVIGEIWEERPSLPKGEAYVFPEKYSGKSTKDKLEAVRNVIKKDKLATMHILSTLEDIAWLYNFRGSDIAYTPVVLAHTVITEKKAILFADKDKFKGEVLKHLQKNEVELRDYFEFYDYIKGLVNENILVDIARINEYTRMCINSPVNKELKEENSGKEDNFCFAKHVENPTIRMKAIKNPVELENIRKAYEKDGVACTEMAYYIKEGRKVEEPDKQLSELTAVDKILEFRKKQENFIEESFDTISGYGANAAMAHYHATEEDYSIVEDKGLFLMDSGGHYFEGTTDITRTFAMGEIAEEERTHFTLVLKGMINLASAKFLYGVTGGNLDVLARQPMWNKLINYNHGTGHGVGHVLSVHEGPASLRWNKSTDKSADVVLEEGMVLTDEPGIYIDGSHGIRIENQLIVVKDIENEYGQFLKFDTVTLCPIDLDAVDLKMMTEDELQWLKEYHQRIYDVIGDRLQPDTKDWLKKIVDRL